VFDGSKTSEWAKCRKALQNRCRVWCGDGRTGFNDCTNKHLALG
jgi:hypothetical protein